MMIVNKKMAIAHFDSNEIASYNPMINGNDYYYEIQ